MKQDTYHALSLYPLTGAPPPEFHIVCDSGPILHVAFALDAKVDVAGAMRFEQRDLAFDAARHGEAKRARRRGISSLESLIFAYKMQLVLIHGGHQDCLKVMNEYSICIYGALGMAQGRQIRHSIWFLHDWRK